jgi:hypothetical protein
VQDLQLPWTDKTEEAAREEAISRALAALSGGRPSFRNTPIPAPMKDGTFGYVGVSGANNGREEYFKSVHLPPGGLAEELKAKKLADKQEWLDKLVVDTTSFKPFCAADNVRTERLKGMLRGDAKKDSLKFIQAGGSVRGHSVPPLASAPISISLSEPWTDPRSIKSPFRAGTSAAQPFVTAALPPAIKDSKVYMPLRSAGISVSAAVGVVPTVATHKSGINTDSSS